MIEEYGSEPHKPVRCEFALPWPRSKSGRKSKMYPESFLVLVEVCRWNYEDDRKEVEQTESGKHFHEEVENEYSYLVES